MHRARILDIAAPEAMRSRFSSLEEVRDLTVFRKWTGDSSMNRSTDKAIAVRNLEKNDSVLLSQWTGISFAVQRGEIFGFLGPNVLENPPPPLLCGILKPTDGEGQVAGYDIITQPEAVKQTIGYMSQRFSLYEDLTPRENIRFYLGIYNVPAGSWKDRIDWVLDI
jgi:ABC-2 type transport system ATP-binding protein